MKKPLDIFCEVPCLIEKSQLFSGTKLHKKWFKMADKRIIGQYLQKFIVYNTDLFSFLNVFPMIIGTDQSTSLCFRTSEFIGSIPLRSPDTGKQIGDFVVTPRFTGKDKYGDYIEILDLLGATISPQFAESFPLASGRNFRPPMYLEAVKFIDSLESLVKITWRKFDRKEKILNAPAGQVDWNKYALNVYKTENNLRFPVGKNVLSEFHKEYSQIRYVYDLCQKELSSAKTPYKIKLALKARMAYLNERLYHHLPSKTDSINIYSADSRAVKNCKSQANKVLNFEFTDSVAWRVDFADVFEKFVQHIFRQVAKELGGRLHANLNIQGYSKRKHAWELKSLEPDAVFEKGDLLVFIDAKYKAHFYNKFNFSEILKEEHRRDIHQIAAYSSFSTGKRKYGFLCYPAEEVSIENVTYVNSVNNTVAQIRLMGLPLKKNIIPDAKKTLMRDLTLIEKETFSL